MQPGDCQRGGDDVLVAGELEEAAGCALVWACPCLLGRCRSGQVGEMRGRATSSDLLDFPRVHRGG